MQILTYFIALAAVARVSMFIPDDRLFHRVKKWLIRARGEDSQLAYLATCNWCISIWVGLLIMPATVFITWGWNQWLLAVLSVPTSSLVAGALAKLRE